MRGHTSKNDTFHANIQINGPKLHGFPGEKNTAKGFRGNFFDAHCILTA